jgi:hypothetical protein
VLKCLEDVLQGDTVTDALSVEGSAISSLFGISTCYILRNFHLLHSSPLQEGLPSSEGLWIEVQAPFMASPLRLIGISGCASHIAVRQRTEFVELLWPTQ